MIRRKMVDIIISTLLLSLSLVILILCQPSDVHCEDVEDTYEVVVTEEDKIVVEESSETETSIDTSTEIVDETTETETEIETEIDPTYWCEWLAVEISQEDYELLCRTTYCEAGGEPFQTQVMVCLAILNQYGSGKFADTIHGVVYAKNAFSVTQWKDFEYRVWNEKTEEAVQMALAKNEHPRDMYYFRTGHYHKWAKNYMKSGKVYFSTDK